MRSLWIVLCFVAAGQCHSPAILWPADQFELRDGQSALDTMAMENFQKIFQGKKVVIFHKRTLSIEDVAYPSKPLRYLQSVDAVALQGVDSVQKMITSLTASDSLKIVNLEDGDLADQDQLIKDTMQANPGFAAILIGSGSGTHRLSRRDVTDEPSVKPACSARGEPHKCLAYVAAVQKILPNGKTEAGTCEVECIEENRITLEVGDANGSSITVKMERLDGGYYISVEGNYTLDADSLWAPEAFSFSCSDLSIIPKKDNVNKSIFSLQGLQLYPKENQESFPESFDCATWFTPALWMGTSIVIFYLGLLFVAILLLLDVKTNDRFDDPKGKTITVNVAD